jgi:hypothetical protein
MSRRSLGHPEKKQKNKAKIQFNEPNNKKIFLNFKIELLLLMQKHKNTNIPRK